MPRRKIGAPVAIATCALVGALSGWGSLGLVTAGVVVASLAVFLIPIWGVLAAVAAKPIVDLFWYNEIGSFLGGKLNVQAIVGIAVPIAILARAIAYRRQIRVTPVLVLGGVYALVLALGVLLSPSRGSALADFFRIALPLSFLLAGFELGARRVSAIGIGVFLAIYGLVPVFAALIELFGLLPVSAAGVVNAGTVLRLRGLYQHPLDIAMRCNMAVPFILMIWQLSGSKFEAWSSGAWACVMSCVAIGTLVRSAVVATTVELSAWFWMSGLRRYAALVPILGLVLAFSWAPLRKVVVNAVEPLRTGAAYRFGSGRTLILLAQVNGFREASPVRKLIGRGLHTSAAVSVEYSPLPDINPLSSDFEEGKVTAHNQIMRLLTENGVLGVVVFFAFAISAARYLWLLARGDVERPHRLFAIATLSTLTAAAVYSLSATPFDVPAVTWPLWLAVGVACGYGSLYPWPTKRNTWSQILSRVWVLR